MTVCGRRQGQSKEKGWAVTAVSIKWAKTEGVAWGDVCQLCEGRWGDPLQSYKKMILPVQSLKEGEFTLPRSNPSIEESANHHEFLLEAVYGPAPHISEMDANHSLGEWEQLIINMKDLFVERFGKRGLERRGRSHREGTNMIRMFLIHNLGLNSAH